MIWLKLLGFWRVIWNWLSHASLWQIISLGLCALLLVQHFQLADARHDRDAWRRQFTSEHNGRLADRKAYQDAQTAAAAKNKAHVAEVEKKQEQITNEVKDDLTARLELIRRELRNSAAKGSAGGTSVPKGGEAPCRTLDPAWMCLSPEERLRAAENEERHDQLINWNLKQSAIDPNK